VGDRKFNSWKKPEYKPKDAQGWKRPVENVESQEEGSTKEDKAED
jgi:hypothetical protein